MGVEEPTPFNNFEVESSGMPRVPAAMNPRAEVVAVLMLFVLVEAAEEASIYNVEESCSGAVTVPANELPLRWKMPVEDPLRSLADYLTGSGLCSKFLTCIGVCP